MNKNNMAWYCETWDLGQWAMLMHRFYNNVFGYVTRIKWGRTEVAFRFYRGETSDPESVHEFYF